MAPHVEQHAPGSIRSSLINRREISALWESIKNFATRDSSVSKSMTKAWNVRKSVVARSTMDGGQIAGAVVGAILGGALIILVAGFIFFRIRRSQHKASEDLLPTKQPVTQRRVSFPGQGYLPGDNEAIQRETPRSIKDGASERGISLGDGNGFQQSPISPTGPTLMGDNDDFYTHLPTQQTDFPQEYDLSSPRRVSAPFSDALVTSTSLEQTTTAPGASNADYYNANVAMESDPEQASMAPPTRQMTELYQEQLRLAREKRKSSKGSTFSRVMNTFKRKRSSRMSDLPFEAGPDPESSAVRQPDVPLESIEGRSEPQGQWTPANYAAAPGSQFYTEPQDMNEGVDSEPHQSKKSKLQGQSQDSSIGSPPRIDSLRTALQAEPTPDPQLPSSAFGRPSASPITRFGPQAPRIHTRDSYRLNSPDIPSPMTVGAQGFTSDVDTSVLRGSNSPPLPPETFVDPMAIMNPTTDTEKAAYHQTAWERWNSTSPPRDSASPAHGADVHESQQPGYDGRDDEELDDEMYDEDEEEEEEEEEEPESDIDMDNPVIAEPVQYGTQFGNQYGNGDYGPSDYSTPAGQSSSNPSSGRTPDTRITSSPSPYVNDFIKAESTASPEALTAVAANKSALTCEECGRTFDQIHKLNHHKRYHDRKHACHYEGCDKKFGTKTHLDRHINDKHEKKKGFHCPEPSCPYFHGGKAFPRKDNWRRHMQNKHGLSPPSGAEPVSSFGV